MMSHLLPFRRAIILLLASGFSTSVPAAETTIEMFQGSFLPQSVSIEVGDAVTWAWRKGTHTVTSGRPDGQAGTPGEPGLLFDAPMDEGHPSFTFRFVDPNVRSVPFFCRLHPGQIGSVEISSGEITVRVGVVDNAFVPDAVDIFEGDSVRWEHEPNEGFHTITSGTSSRPEDQPGLLFDEESSEGRPVFVFRFEMAGDYPYFCRPHEHMGMKGLVSVQKRFLRGDATGDGIHDISDPIRILSHIFRGADAGFCDDAMDSNDDGAVGIEDPILLLNMLFLGKEAPPSPFLVPGADRTDDGLRCDP